jgi:hypothetical protein
MPTRTLGRRIAAGIGISAILVIMAMAISPRRFVDAYNRPGDASRDVANRWIATLDGSSSQASLLGDKVVSSDEYRSALLGATTCLERSGFVAEIRTALDEIRLELVVREGSGDADSVTSAWAACRRDYYAAVEAVWIAQHSRVSEGQAVLLAEYDACLRANGTAVPSPRMNDFDLTAYLAETGAPLQAWACRERFLLFTGEFALPPH